MRTVLTQQQVEQMIYRCRMRQLHAETFGPETSAKIYAARMNWWLELWPAAHVDRTVCV